MSEPNLTSVVLERSGDRWCARCCGCQTVLLLHDYMYDDNGGLVPPFDAFVGEHRECAPAMTS